MQPASTQTMHNRIKLSCHQAGELNVFDASSTDKEVEKELHIARAKAQSAAEGSQSEFTARILAVTAAVAANADGSIHGDAGTSDLPLFLIKIEGEYLCYLSQVLAANTMQVEKARALFAEGSLRARGATADFGAESPIRIGLVSVF